MGRLPSLIYGLRAFEALGFGGAKTVGVLRVHEAAWLKVPVGLSLGTQNGSVEVVAPPCNHRQLTTREHKLRGLSIKAPAGGKDRNQVAAQHAIKVSGSLRKQVVVARQVARLFRQHVC
jgi:hypothetical protein